MPSVKHTDLGEVMPGPQADPLMERQRVTLHIGGLGLRARLGVDTTGGASHAVATLVVLTAGAVPAGMVSLVGIVAGAPGWLVLGLAAAVSLVHLAVGAVLVERQRRREPHSEHVDAARRPGTPRPVRTPAKTKPGRER